MPFLKRFTTDEDGAVTVDWVVLTAAIVVFSVLVGTAMTDPINNELDAIALVVENTTN